MASRYRAALDATLYGTDLPYGYTLSIWGAGAATIALRGTPTVWHAILFVTAASVGYGVLRVLSQHSSDSREITLSDTTHPIRTVVVQLAAIAAAVGAAAVMADLIASAAAWPLAGFVATLSYLAITAVDTALVLGEQR